MRKLVAYNFVTLNGYFAGPKGDLSWHTHGGEEAEYAAEGAQSESTLLFGRVTYEQMASYWPTPNALRDNPGIAEGMNRSEKVVFSRTLSTTHWRNSRLVKDDMVEEVKRMKEQPGNDMTILGSGSIITQLAEAGLIDEFLLMVDPVALGDGTPLLKGLKRKLNLTLTNSRVFKSGVVLLCYKPSE